MMSIEKDDNVSCVSITLEFNDGHKETVNIDHNVTVSIMDTVTDIGTEKQYRKLSLILAGNFHWHWRTNK